MCTNLPPHTQTFDGAKQYLRDWAATMRPEYLMASTPHDFHYAGKEATATGCKGEEEREHEHVEGAGACGVTMIDRSPKARRFFVCGGWRPTTTGD